MMKLIIEDGRYYIVETPDVITIVTQGKPKKLFNWYNAGAAFPFGYWKGKMAVGIDQGTHRDMIGGNRRKLGFSGRMWIDKKVLSFWSYPSISELKKVIKDLEHTFNNVILNTSGARGDEEDIYGTSIRASDYGKLNIDNSWKLDVPAEGEENYEEFTSRMGGADVVSRDSHAHGYLYTLKTIFSKRKLKGSGEKLRKGKKVVSDTGQEHVAPAMLKKSAITKMDQRQKTSLYNYFKAKGRLSPAEKRMYKMISKEGIELYFDGEKVLFVESIESDLKKRLEKFDDSEVEMGIEAEKEHDTDDELDVVNSSVDLLKIALAHLEEDPHYYTKLKKIEERSTKTFTLEEGSGILVEAPHISIGEQSIDFEFEVDKVAGLKKIIKAIMRETITDKHGNKFKISSDKEMNEFITKLIKLPQVRRLIK